MYAMPAVFSIIATVRDRVLVLDLVSARGSASRAAPHTSRTLRSRRPIIASTPRSSRSQQPSQGSSAADVMCSWKLPSEPGGRRPFRLPAQVSSIVYDSFHAFVSLVDPSNATPQPFNPSTSQPFGISDLGPGTLAGRAGPARFAFFCICVNVLEAFPLLQYYEY